MSRTVAVIWHASFSLVAAGLYFFFVLPRWPELMGQTSPTLGLVLRIVTAVVIALAALPVVFTLLRTSRPEYGTPELALRLRTLSIVLHVLAGVLILGAALSEIWLPLDKAGQWQFGVYGAAAAIALLGVFGFYLAFVAELPPPPPKPVKTREKTGRGRNKTVEVSEVSADSEDSGEVESDDSDADEVESEADAEAHLEKAIDADVARAEDADVAKAEDADVAEDDAAEADSTDDVTALEPESTAEEAEPIEDAAPRGKLRNRRRKRSSGGVAVED